LIVKAFKELGAIKYKTLKPVAHAAREPQVLEFMSNFLRKFNKN
jgi:chorismate mutase